MELLDTAHSRVPCALDPDISPFGMPHHTSGTTESGDQDGRVMGSVDSERRFSLDQFARDPELKQELEVLKKENSRLKGLVIQLSEAIIRNVIGKK